MFQTHLESARLALVGDQVTLSDISASALLILDTLSLTPTFLGSSDFKVWLKELTHCG
jgi:hypothetical protein